MKPKGMRIQNFGPMNEQRIQRMVSQVWNYVAADVPSKMAVDLLQETDYFTLHATDKEAAKRFWLLSEKKQKALIQKAIG